MLGSMLALHVLGIILWVGGVFAAGRVLLDHARSGPGPSFTALERSLMLRTAHPGMLLVLLTGAAMLAFNPEYYLREYWMLAKLGVAVLMILPTIALTVASRRMAERFDASCEGKLRRWRRLFMGLALAELILVFVKPI